MGQARSLNVVAEDLAVPLGSLATQPKLASRTCRREGDVTDRHANSRSLNLTSILIGQSRTHLLRLRLLRRRLIRHRLLLNYRAEADRVEVETIIARLLETVRLA